MVGAALEHDMNIRNTSALIISAIALAGCFGSGEDIALKPAYGEPDFPEYQDQSPDDYSQPTMAQALKMYEEKVHKENMQKTIDAQNKIFDEHENAQDETQLGKDIAYFEMYKDPFLVDTLHKNEEMVARKEQLKEKCLKSKTCKESYESTRFPKKKDEGKKDDEDPNKPSTPPDIQDIPESTEPIGSFQKPQGLSADDEKKIDDFMTKTEEALSKGESPDLSELNEILTILKVPENADITQKFSATRLIVAKRGNVIYNLKVDSVGNMTELAEAATLSATTLTAAKFLDDNTEGELSYTGNGKTWAITPVKDSGGAGGSGDNEAKYEPAFISGDFTYKIDLAKKSGKGEIAMKHAGKVKNMNSGAMSVTTDGKIVLNEANFTTLSASDKVPAGAVGIKGKVSWNKPNSGDLVSNAGDNYVLFLVGENAEKISGHAKADGVPIILDGKQDSKAPKP